MAPAKVKYTLAQESRNKVFASVPRGVAISKPSGFRAEQSTQAKDHSDFFGASLAPTLNGSQPVHISLAVSGICTVLIDKHTQDQAAHGLGTFVTVKNGEFTTENATVQNSVGHFLQRNGPTTALVWISRPCAITSAGDCETAQGTTATHSLGGTPQASTAGLRSAPPVDSAADESADDFAASAYNSASLKQPAPKTKKKKRAATDLVRRERKKQSTAGKVDAVSIFNSMQ